MISYLALLDVCKQINDSARSKKQQRNVSVIQDIDGNNIVVINDIRFKGKRSIDWKEVRAYLKKYVGDFYKVASTGDVIYIGDDLPSEYADQNIHIVSKEQMRKRKRMLYKEFLK